jgi:hypothetical protein
MKWMDTQCLQIAVNTGAKLGRVTIARAILNGLSKAGLSLAACRSECEVEDVARALATPALEVKG